MWVMVVLMVIVILAAIFLQPEISQPSPQDFDVPSAKEGKEIAVLFGTNDVKDYTVVWFGDISTTAIRKKGGKK